MSDSGDVVQISKADLAALQKSYSLLNKLWDHPEHGAELKRAAKVVDPTLRIPEIDVAEPLLKPIRDKQAEIEADNVKLREELAADRKERQDAKDIGDLSKALNGAQSKFRLTDEGMAEVRKIMAERNVADPEVAAQYVVANIERAPPVSGSNFAPTDANILGIDGKSQDEDIRFLHNDPIRWLDSAVPKIMAEFEQEAA